MLYHWVDARESDHSEVAGAVGESRTVGQWWATGAGPFDDRSVGLVLKVLALPHCLLDRTGGKDCSFFRLVAPYLALETSWYLTSRYSLFQDESRPAISSARATHQSTSRRLSRYLLRSLCFQPSFQVGASDKTRYS